MMTSLGFQVKENFSGDLIENLLSAGSLFRDHRWPFPSAVRIFAKPVGTGQGTGDVWRRPLRSSGGIQRDGERV